MQAVLNGRAKPEGAAAEVQRDAGALDLRPYLERTALRLPV